MKWVKYKRFQWKVLMNSKHPMVVFLIHYTAPENSKIFDFLSLKHLSQRIDQWWLQIFFNFQAICDVAPNKTVLLFKANQ